MSIKMVALDLDGTTLHDNGKFSERTIKAFYDAMKKGVHIVVATGRAVHSLPKKLFEIEGLEYAVTSNGARIIDVRTRETIRASFVDEEAVRTVHDYLVKRNAMIEIFCRGRAYISADEFDRIVNNGETRRNREYVSSTRTPVDDIYAMLWENAGEIENISINYFDLEEKKNMEEGLVEIPNITLTSSFLYNNEIGGASTSKANSLKYLMDMLSISPEELMCCGDSPNDLAMIELAGIGVAMGNAMERVKEEADYITATNNDDGVAKAIEKFVLNEQ